MKGVEVGGTQTPLTPIRPLSRPRFLAKRAGRDRRISLPDLDFRLPPLNGAAPGVDGSSTPTERSYWGLEAQGGSRQVGVRHLCGPRYLRPVHDVETVPPPSLPPSFLSALSLPRFTVSTSRRSPPRPAGGSGEWEKWECPEGTVDCRGCEVDARVAGEAAGKGSGRGRLRGTAVLKVILHARRAVVKQPEPGSRALRSR